MTELLKVDDLTAGYGASVVLENISFDLRRGEALALLGRNGVGKSTLLATLMGQTRVHGGAVHWKHTPITHLASHFRAGQGLGWVPQERWIFPSLTVHENLTVASRAGHWTPHRIYQLFPSLDKRRTNLGDELSGGEQQMLAMGRALMINPDLLLLDEPTEGLAPLVAKDIHSIIGSLTRAGDMTVIVVEQHVRFALSICTKALVLDRGRVVLASDTTSLLADSSQLEQYIGISRSNSANDSNLFNGDPQ